MDDVLYVGDGQAVACDGGSVDLEVEVVAAHDALGVNAQRAGDIADDPFDLLADALEFVEVGPGDLDADGGLDSGGKHVDAGLDRHGPGVGQTGDLDRRIHFVDELVGSHALAPFAFGLERDRGFHHGKRGGVGGCFGAADFAEYGIDLGKRLDDLVGLLQDLAGLGGGDAGQGGRHVKQVALPERRHELRPQTSVGNHADREQKNHQRENRPAESKNDFQQGAIDGNEQTGDRVALFGPDAPPHPVADKDRDKSNGQARPRPPWRRSW